MKKKTVVLRVIIILCLITVVFSSCGNKETKIIYDGNLNKVNFNYMSDGVTFMLTFASTDENIEIGETSFHGVNTANIMPIKYNNEAVAREEQKNLTSKAKKDGYYLHMIAVGVTVNSGYEGEITVSKITQNISGVDYDFEFDTPAVFVHIPEKSAAGYSLVCPLVISDDSVTQKGSFAHNFYMNDKNIDSITIQNTYFTDFIEFDEAVLIVNGEIIGTLKECLPYEAKTEDEKITIQSSYKYKEESNCTEFDYIWTTLVVEFTKPGDDTVYKTTFPINIQGIASVEEAQEALEYILSNSK